MTARPILLCLLAVTGLALAADDARAQDRLDWNQTYDPYVAALGLNAGLSSGTGLAVRWPALPQTMATISGGVWSNDRRTYWDLGFELHYILRQSVRTRMFVGPAVALYHDGGDDETDVNASFGVGVEVLAWPRVAVKADVGFTYQGSDGDIFPLPQFGVFYYF